MNVWRIKYFIVKLYLYNPSYFKEKEDKNRLGKRSSGYSVFIHWRKQIMKSKRGKNWIKKVSLSKQKRHSVFEQ